MQSLLKRWGKWWLFIHTAEHRGWGLPLFLCWEEKEDILYLKEASLVNQELCQEWSTEKEVAFGWSVLCCYLKLWGRGAGRGATWMKRANFVYLWFLSGITDFIMLRFYVKVVVFVAFVGMTFPSPNNHWGGFFFSAMCK